MKKNFYFTCLITIVFLNFFASCKKNGGPTNPPANNPPPMETETRTGMLQPVQGSTVSSSNLKVISFAGLANVDSQGSFSISATKAEKYQQLLVTSKNTGNLIYIGLFDPATKQVTVNDTSSVLSLLLINPHLLNTTQDQRKQYIETAKRNGRFPQLLSLFRQGLQTNAENIFDFDSNPTLYQVAIEIMKETIEALQSGGYREQSRILFGGEPTIEDASGDDIIFVNPRHVYYGAGIYPNDASLKEVVTVNRQESIVGFKWSWPPISLNEPARTNYTLGNGSFRIYLAKGIDFSKFLQWNDPVGRATTCNIAQTLISTFDLVIGSVPSPPIVDLPHHFTLSATRLISIGENIRTKNPLGFVSDLTKAIVENKEALALWFWQDAVDDAGREAARATAEKLAGILSNVSLAFKLLSFANGTGPLYFDLIFAPSELNYYITQQNGTITSNTNNLQPTAQFSIDPPAGIVATNFQFEASGSTDDHDNLSQLQFRWDWESDGTWDTDWSNGYTATHSFPSSGSFVVTLAVRDVNGLIGTSSHTLNVGGGAGTASHVKLFMDIYPWESDALIRVLVALDFTEGNGQKTYEIISSSNMGTASLIPGQDLVIISNDQNQTFYNNYANNQMRFTNFVNNGGALLWEACDKGWNYGSMQQAGVMLPGNITSDLKYVYYNYVRNSQLPLVAGLPVQMDHNYASHERFDGLPDGTTVYCVDTDSKPTLIEFNLGAGWIIITGQPLEHQFDRIYGSPDMEKLLPRIVAYFTGNPLPLSVFTQRKGLPARPSYVP